VIGDAVSIVHLDDDLVVVHKPPSVPVSCHSSLMMFVVVVIVVVVIVVDWQIPENNQSPCDFIVFLHSSRKEK
jgi:hypothetical protein